MVVLLECVVDVPRHGVVDMALLVAPGEFYASEEQAHPVNDAIVVFLECRLEVIKIYYAHYFDAKVVND
jgi:hypothetical protein